MQMDGGALRTRFRAQTILNALLMRDSPKVEVLLRGGLGNQLFGMSTGFALARRLGLGLALQSGEFGPNRVNHFLEVRPNLPSFIEISEGVTTNRYFQEKGFRYDSRIETVDGAVLLDGYFQSSKYFSAYRTEISELIRNFPSFNQGLVSGQETSVIGLQYRRGDYTLESARNFHGLLSDHYFIEAVSLVRKLVGDLPVVIHSDDSRLAEKLSLEISNSEVFYAASGRSVWEVLGWLSACRAQIISNSTFGWWAAFLGGAENTVVAPRPWFRSHQMDTQDLLEKGWLTLGWTPG